MAITIGSSGISALKLGSSNVTSVYQGTNLIYPTGCTSPLISTTSLSAYYKFNNNLNASVGPGPLIAPNGISYATGKFGDANGSSLYNGSTFYTSYEFPDAAYGGSGNNISVMLWVYPTGISSIVDVINYFNSTVSQGWRIRFDGTTSQINYTIGATTLAPSGSIPLNTWTHIGFTYNNLAGGFRAYRNGVLVASGGSANMVTNNVSLNFRIGRRNLNGNPGNWFIGRIDEVNIWQRALTASEVNILATTNCPLT